MTRIDVLVVGATPCGISAAIAAARCGSKVILVEPQDFLGGMLTNGLGRTDIGPRHTVGGIFREFIGNVQDFYIEKYGPDSQQVKDCGNGYWFEPSTAETILKRMVKAEKNIDLRYRYELDSVLKYGNRIHGVTFIDRNGRRAQIRAGVCIDATYEGDLAALSGAAYRVGRESRDEIGEPYAGVIYLDHLTRMVLPGSTGKGDKRVQAYNFRLTLTKKADNRLIPSKPDSYNVADYADLLQSIKSGRVQTFADVIETRTLPNEKFDANNMPKSLQSTDLPVENYDYAENSPEDRAKFYDRLRDYTLGLIYYLQNDSEIPEKLRADASQWGLAKDEYPKNNHFPRQVYVREGRRIQGLYTFTMHDAELAPGLLRSPVHWDSVASGGYAVDSHATRKRESGRDAELEGFFWLSGITQPYQIPYRVILPQTVDALLVPGAASATHLGFGTLRMEPVWMALGQAAGTAAHLARRLHVEPRNIPVSRLQSWLLKDGQVITTFSDSQSPVTGATAETWEAMQFFGTRGFFDSYDAKPGDVLSRGTAAQWLMAAIRAGDIMPYYGPSVKHEGGGAVESSLKQLVTLRIADDPGDPNAILTAGELAIWISRIQPWIDGSWGDTWTNRTAPKDTPPAVDASLLPDNPVTRGSFCEALFARFRSASPVKI